MNVRFVSARLGFALSVALVSALAFAQVGSVAPPWLQQAAEQAIGLDGVRSSQGLKRSGNFFMVLRGHRSCDQDTALWNEFRAVVGDVNVLGGWCWTMVVPPSSRPPTGGHLLSWEFQLHPPLPHRPLPALVELARSLDGVVEAEAWRKTGSYPRVLAMYRSGACPDEPAEDALRLSLMERASTELGLSVEVFAWTCDRSLVGPLYRGGLPPVGTRYVHMRQVAKQTD
jgi:hypothetical protein